MLFYLTVIAIGGSIAITGATVILLLLGLTSDDRCRRIEHGVQARLVRRFSRRARGHRPPPDRQHAPQAQGQSWW